LSQTANHKPKSSSVFIKPIRVLRVPPYAIPSLLTAKAESLSALAKSLPKPPLLHCIKECAIMPKQNSNLSDALEYLNTLILNGGEYPDASYKTTTVFNVNAQDLQDEYDRQFTQVTAMKTYDSRFSEALEYLKTLVSETVIGYLDAIEQTSSKFNVYRADLNEAYDNLFGGDE
jgi:DNA repair ATPase RecN